MKKHQANKRYRIARNLVHTILKKEEAGEAVSEWRNEKDANEHFYQSLHNDDFVDRRLDMMSQFDEEAAWDKFKKGKVLAPKRRLPWQRYGSYAAAAVLLICALLYIGASIRSADIADQWATVQPGSSKAYLKTSSGSYVDLSAVQDSTLEIGHSRLAVNGSDALSYIAGASASSRVAWHTLNVPKGGEYQLTLHDGSKVWLNSDSQLEYPTAFGDRERRVKLKGEAYFDVSSNAALPFVVESMGHDIKVYGTEFNVNAYSPNLLQTVLVEGKVSLLPKGSQVETVLTPGHWAGLDAEGQSILTKAVDTQYYTAWKEGKFVFEGTSLKEILNQAARWYDVEIFYQNPSAQAYQFTAQLKRQGSIKNFLNILEMASDLEFELKGRAVIVKLEKGAE